VIYRRHTGSAPLDALESTHDKEPLDISRAGNIFSLDNCQPYQLINTVKNQGEGLIAGITCEVFTFRRAI